MVPSTGYQAPDTDISTQLGPEYLITMNSLITTTWPNPTRLMVYAFRRKMQRQAVKGSKMSVTSDVDVGLSTGSACLEVPSRDMRVSNPAIFRSKQANCLVVYVTTISVYLLMAPRSSGATRFRLC
jgi:hypothetical protein